MKSARFVFFILLLVMIVVMMAACQGGDGGRVRTTPGSISAEDATATFGAEMFHQQLTAVARDQVTPAAQVP